MRNLQFIQVCPSDPQFYWQTAVQLFNFSKFGYDKSANILVYVNQNRLQEIQKWTFLEYKFPNAKFFYYPDYYNLMRTMIKVDYIPLLRPYLLQKHWQRFPELKNDAIFYHDSDVIFSKPLDIDKYIQDDINYLSYTGDRNQNPPYNYQCYDHFVDKEKNIRPDKLEEYKKANPIEAILKSFNLSIDFFKAHKSTVGGAQYLLKNVSAKFWKEVFEECINVRRYLQRVNQNVMKGETPLERENNGFQSWATDMWVIQWLLWRDNKNVKCPVEMDFTWAPDPLYKWEQNAIYHDAGVPGDSKKLFKKRGPNNEYIKAWDEEGMKMPFEDDLSFVSLTESSSKYVAEIEATKKYLNL